MMFNKDLFFFNIKKKCWKTQGKFQKKRKIIVSDFETNNNYILICFFLINIYCREMMMF